jgi:dTDP-glucose 4,6-dehydratase
MTNQIMKNLLVTGGCGFIGSNFVNYMAGKYPDVKIYNLDCLHYCASLNNVCTVHTPNLHTIIGKIQDQELVTSLLETHQIDTVIHFAAQSHVDSSFTDSMRYTYDNVYGTHTLLECCRNYGKLERFVHISTDEVYGESELHEDEQPKTETSVMCPTNPYAATKAASELISRSYYYSFKLPVIITRGNNVYGPRQYYEKVVPKFIYQLSKGDTCTIHGEGQSRRAFIHVDDVCRAVETITLKGKIGEVYNIGSPDEITVLELAHRLIKAIKGNAEDPNAYLRFVEDRHFNDKRYYISDEKLRSLGWSPQVQLEDGLNKTIQWYASLDSIDNHWADTSHKRGK